MMLVAQVKVGTCQKYSQSNSSSWVGSSLLWEVIGISFLRTMVLAEEIILSLWIHGWSLLFDHRCPGSRVTWSLAISYGGSLLSWSWERYLCCLGGTSKTTWCFSISPYSNQAQQYSFSYYPLTKSNYLYRRSSEAMAAHHLYYLAKEIFCLRSLINLVIFSVLEMMASPDSDKVAHENCMAA